MKKLFIQPEIKVSVFSIENLITASGNKDVVRGVMTGGGTTVDGIAEASIDLSGGGSQE